MDAMMEIGSPVRYPRTGTVGKIIRIEERSGFLFAELDSTGMLYRTDLLVPAMIVEKTTKSEDLREELKQVEKEHAHPDDFAFEELPTMDGACNGAG